MESKTQAFKRRFSTELVLTIVTGASLILATTMAGFVALDNVNKDKVISGACFGADGIDGTDGSDGATGINGAVGIDGETSSPGASGIAGVDGSTGAAGAAGESGAAGTAGPTGSAGSSGAPGTPGTHGATGAPGTTGAQGAQGATGATGATGTCDLSIDLLPKVDNELSIGDSKNRWKSLFLGSGSISFQDVNNPELTVGINFADGTLILDGASALQVGNVRIASTPGVDVKTETYAATAICIEEKTNVIHMLTCEENAITGLDSSMFIKQ